MILYIGSVGLATFDSRISGPRWWISREPRRVDIYLGYLGATSPLPTDETAAEERGNWILVAEGILIYFCRPPINAQDIQSCSNEPVVVFNVGEWHTLPATLSNLWLKSPALNDPAFRFFEYQRKSPSADQDSLSPLAGRRSG
jgi:hypothetical protein